MRLPHRSLTVIGASLAVSGVCSYAFLASASRTLDPRDYARLAAAWGLIYIAEPALFAPPAQVMARNLAAGRVHDDRAALVTAARTSAVILAVLAAVAVVLRSALLHGLFDGDTWLYTLVHLAVPCHLLLALAGGFSTGRHRYSVYGRLIAADAIVRLVTALAAAIAGVTTPAPFAVAFVVGPLVALAWNRHALRIPTGRPATRGDLTASGRSVAYQMLASSVAIAMLSSGPILVKALADADDVAEAGRFQNAISISQAPLLVLNALLVVILPAWSSLAGRGDVVGLAQRVRTTLLAHLGAVALAVAVGTVLGPMVVRVAYGADYAVSSTDFAILVAGAGAFFGAQLGTQALLALKRERLNNVAYLLGGVAMASTVWLGSDLALFRRVELAFLMGTATAYGAVVIMVTATLRLRRSLARCAQPSVIDLRDAGERPVRTVGSIATG
jgi:O-antigen/teichoic acid export membrane protein